MVSGVEGLFVPYLKGLSVTTKTVANPLKAAISMRCRSPHPLTLLIFFSWGVGVGRCSLPLYQDDRVLCLRMITRWVVCGGAWCREVMVCANLIGGLHGWEMLQQALLQLPSRGDQDIVMGSLFFLVLYFFDVGGTVSAFLGRSSHSRPLSFIRHHHCRSSILK